MVILTGDTHRDFARIFEFSEEYGTTRDDILVILGDAGINYCLDESDEALKRELSQLEVTLLCVHGNHEERPSEILSYGEVEWHGGLVYAEPEYPNLLFAKDGEIYDLEGRTAMAIGGAYSIDKYYRLANRLPWFESEQPDETIKAFVEAQLDRAGWQMGYIFSHAAPLQWEPRHAFLPGLNQSLVDKTTEKWLDGILRRVRCGGWFCGHYHIDDRMGPVHIVYHDFLELDTGDEP